MNDDDEGEELVPARVGPRPKPQPDLAGAVDPAAEALQQGQLDGQLVLFADF